MEMEQVKLLFDMGLFVLIWMIQLIVYPSFLQYEKENLLKWHSQYTVRLSMLVIPLMLGQLALSILVWLEFRTLGWGIGNIGVIGVWISTFLQFVPIHKKIAQSNATHHDLRLLVKRNWIRTTLWTLIFMWSVFLVYRT
jgi:hypothetical protein